MTITPEQCRGARAMLGISRERLALAAGLVDRTIAYFEARERMPMPETVHAIRRALEEAGAIFIACDEPGVRLRKGIRP